MVLWALFAFWHPLACKALGSFNETQLKQKARNAIYQLLQHINYLIEIFDLDPQEFMLQVPGQQLNSKPPLSQVPFSKSIESVKTTSSSATTGELPTNEPNEMLTNTPELTRNEDDELLEEVFNR